MKTMYALTDRKSFASFASKYRGVDMSDDIDDAQLYKTKEAAQKVADTENRWREDIPQLFVVEVEVTRSTNMVSV